MTHNADCGAPNDLLYEAWVVIANASGWDGEGGMEREWRAAAIRWRDKWHATLPSSLTPPGGQS